MAEIEVTPRESVRSIAAVWVLAAVLALTIGAVAPSEWEAAWMPVALGACVVVSFAVQLRSGHPKGFIDRVAASVLGSLLVIALVGAGLGLANLFA